MRPDYRANVLTFVPNTQERKRIEAVIADLRPIADVPGCFKHAELTAARDALKSYVDWFVQSKEK